jgi:hypothetical protein
MLLERLLELLSDNELRKRLEAEFDHVRSTASGLPDLAGEDATLEGMEDPEEALNTAINMHDIDVAELFHDHVQKRFDPPDAISPMQMAYDLLELIDPHDPHARTFEEVYQLFLHDVRTKLFAFRHSRPFAICRLHSQPEWDAYMRGVEHMAKAMADAQAGVTTDPPNLQRGEADSTRRHFWSIHDVNIELAGSAPAALDPERADAPGTDQLLLFAVAEGTTSRQLFDAIVREVPKATRSLLLTHVWLTSDAMPRISEARELPACDLKQFTSAEPFLHEGLDRHFSSPTRRDSLDRRLRNAIHLLVQSDAQTHDSLSVALSMSAMEALLSERQDITKTLAERTAALLEPEGDKRGAADTFVRKLYQVRSDLLHGTRLESETMHRLRARFLAGAVLNAVMEWQSFWRRIEPDSDSPDKLFAGLREAMFRATRIDGVTDSIARRLWLDPVWRIP